MDYTCQTQDERGIKRYEHLCTNDGLAMTKTISKTLETRNIRRELHCAPTLPEGSTLIFDEPGRVLVCKPESNDVNYQSYYFRVGLCYNRATLYVRHGAGQESFPLHSCMQRVLEHLTSDERYFVLYAIWNAHNEATNRTRVIVETTYQQAHADGRLKRRKVRGQAAVKVWIEPAIA